MAGSAEEDGLTMDNQRLILFILFTFSCFMLFEAWQRETRPPVQPAAVAGTPSGPAETAVPLPTQPLNATPAPAAPAPSGARPAPTGALQQGETIRVETDLYVADISTAGGDLRRLELLEHRDTLDRKKNFLLLQEIEHTYVAQAGLIGNGLPNHRTKFTATASAVKLDEGAPSVSVRLTAPDVGGIKVDQGLHLLSRSLRNRRWV